MTGRHPRQLLSVFPAVSTTTLTCGCRNVSMEMTMPVISNAGQSAGQDPTMQFVMEERYGSDAEALPAPNDPKYASLPFIEFHPGRNRPSLLRPVWKESHVACSCGVKLAQIAAYGQQIHTLSCEG